jgi:caffeoyl-CoA O-methyltransferase
MCKCYKSFLISLIFVIFSLSFSSHIYAETKETALDEKVKTFLDKHHGSMHDMNVPAEDGKALYDLIIKNNYKSALEIGTSTGYSTIWIAWALSKTGGKLITIEIDEGRYKQAVENFKAAGLSGYIDARLADAHALVKELPGPFDFVFSDADKDWYINYFNDLLPKLTIGGCFISHNIDGESAGFFHDSDDKGKEEYYKYITGLKTMESILNKDGGGMLISYKRSQLIN